MSEPKVTREERLLEVLKILPYLRSKHPLYHEEFDAIRALIREHGPEVSKDLLRKHLDKWNQHYGFVPVTLNDLLLIIAEIPMTVKEEK